MSQTMPAANPADSRSPLEVRWLGRVAYVEAERVQERLVRARRTGELPDVLLLLEHPPVITLGRGSDRRDVLISADEAQARGIEIRECGRGGNVTYHGPGQLVGYPILALAGPSRDAHRYLRNLEQALIRTAADFGVRATRRPGLTGVWVGSRKLAALGVRISTGWITSHGFALNVDGDLAGFETIVPCGLRESGVTSLSELTGRRIALKQTAERVSARLAQQLNRRLRPAAKREALS